MHIELILDVEKSRTTSVMDTMYFVAIKDLTLKMYKDVCKLHKYNGTSICQWPVNILHILIFCTLKYANDLLIFFIY